VCSALASPQCWPSIPSTLGIPRHSQRAALASMKRWLGIQAENERSEVSGYLFIFYHGVKLAFNRFE